MLWYKRQVKWICGWMIVLAVIFRMAALGWDSIMPTQEQLVTGLFFLGTGTVGHFDSHEIAEAPPISVQEAEPILAEIPEPKAEPAPPSPEPEPTTPTKILYTQAQADAIDIGGAGTYDGELLPLLNQDLDLDFSGESPTILILHTHTSEAYAQAVGREYTETDTARTQDEAYNIVRVGQVVAEYLTDGGLSVIHDKTVHDYPNYNNSYSNALDSIKFWLEKYPSITMVIDIHRDAAVDGNGLPMACTTEIAGKDVAQAMLVVGTDQGGLTHPNWEGNLAFALQLQATLQSAYPNYVRSLNLRKERFNQHATPASILVEIGTHGNTLEEALASAEILAQGILDLTMQYQ